MFFVGFKRVLQFELQRSDHFLGEKYPIIYEKLAALTLQFTLEFWSNNPFVE